MSGPDPDEFRRALHEAADAASRGDGSPAPIDVDAVLTRSRAARRRRRNALLGGAAGAVLVVAAGGVALSTGFGSQHASTSADAPVTSESLLDASGPADSAEDGAGAGGEAGGEAGVAPADQTPETELVMTPIDRLNRCGAPPAAASGAANSPAAAQGLTITVATAGPIPSGGTGTVVVTITNGGSTAYSGELVAGPAVTLADGVTRWHTSGIEAVRRPLELAPGASLRLDAEVRALACDADDESGQALPTTLPALAPGDYRVSAAVSLASDDSPLGTPFVSSAVPLAVVG